MATFKNQVQGLTQITISGSSAPTEDELSQFLQDGIKDIINKMIVLRPDEAFKFAAESTADNSNGITVTGRILSVLRENGNPTDIRPATPIPDGVRYLATDKRSLHYRTTYNPAFYILNKKVYVLPAPTDANNSAIVSQVSYPSAVHGNSISDIAFPAEYESLIILYAAAMSCYAAAANFHSSVPTAPSSPGEANFFVEGVTLPTLPIYSGPSLDFSMTKVTAKLKEEDVEMAEKEMEKLDKQMDRYSKEGEEAVRKWTKEVEIFKATLDNLTKNADREVQIKATEYRSDIYEYQYAVGAYTAEMGVLTQRYKWYIEQYISFMNQYNSQLQLMIPKPQAPPREEQPKQRERG